MPSPGSGAADSVGASDGVASPNSAARDLVGASGGVASRDLVGASGGVPSRDFVGAVLEVVAAIPPGHVMTYGDVAATLGTRAARAVGTVMAHYGSDVAWWRVVRASGHPVAGHEDRALERYEAEGTPLRHPATGGYRVDLAAARWRG